VGPGDVGPGDVGPGDVGPGDVGPGDVGPGDVIVTGAVTLPLQFVRKTETRTIRKNARNNSR
jgi:hypothetical protein